MSSIQLGILFLLLIMTTDLLQKFYL
uniref:Uncharacterized protein n=1 Tax=Arundo donax TaxID=35708 RepID=A0A0A9SLC1_ARUDO